MTTKRRDVDALTGTADDFLPGTAEDWRKTIKTMTDKDVIEELKSQSPLNKARQEFSSACARIEQAGLQRKPPSPIEIRRMEFEAVTRILKAYVMTYNTTQETKLVNT